jgi:hypothetical protein
MTFAKATAVFCAYCKAPPAEFCRTSSPCEANSHRSRWLDAQWDRMRQLENQLGIWVATAEMHNAERGQKQHMRKGYGCQFIFMASIDEAQKLLAEPDRNLVDAAGGKA